MKYADTRCYADREKAVRPLLEHAQAFEVVQDGRAHIERINRPFLFDDKATPAVTAPA